MPVPLELIMRNQWVDCERGLPGCREISAPWQGLHEADEVVDVLRSRGLRKKRREMITVYKFPACKISLHEEGVYGMIIQKFIRDPGESRGGVVAFYTEHECVIMPCFGDQLISMAYLDHL